MANLGTMLNDLQLVGMSSLVNLDVTTLINKCQREEVETWEWSFCYSAIVINGNPGLVNGNITLTQGSPIVTGSGTTFLSGGALPGWWLFAGATNTLPVNILSVQSDTQFTLTTPFGPPSIAGTTYTLQPFYYDVYPLIEVYRVRQIEFLIEVSQEALNRMDPARTSTGGNPSLNWAPAPYNSSAVYPVTTGQGNASGAVSHYQIELYPRCTSSLPYVVEGKAGAIDLVNPTDVPQIPSVVLEAKAMMYIARAAYMNTGNPRYGEIAKMYEADYTRELENAKYADNKLKVTLGLNALGSGNRKFDMAIDYYVDRWGPPGL